MMTPLPRETGPVLSIALLLASLITTAAQTDLRPVFDKAANHKTGDNTEALRQIEGFVRDSLWQSNLREDLEAGLIALVQGSATFEARRFACKQLAIIGTEKALPALAGLLSAKDTAGMACLGLSTYPPGEADEVLRRALSKSSDASVQVQVINTLGDRRDRKAVKLLANAAKRSDSAVAEPAIAALGKIGTPAARDAVEDIEKSRPELGGVATEARLLFAEQLAGSGKVKEAQAIYHRLLGPEHASHVRRSALNGLLTADRQGASSVIQSVLERPDPVLRPVALTAVRTVIDPGTSRRFGAMLSTLPSQEQVWLIDSLAARGDQPALEVLGRALQASDSEVRLASIRAFAQAGNAASAPILVRALSASKEAEERRAIESALFQLGGGDSVTQALKNELRNTSGLARGHVVTALARREGPASVPLLVSEAEGNDPAAAKAAFRMLGLSGAADDAPAILHALTKVHFPDVRPEAESAASKVLSRVDPVDKRSDMLKAAFTGISEIESRGSLIGLLPICGDEASLRLVQQGFQDSDSDVRAHALEALADWPTLAAYDPLLRIYQNPANDPDRAIALRGLVKLLSDANAKPDAETIAKYHEVLGGARSPADRKLILSALGGSKVPEAVQVARSLLSDTEVRSEAEAAIKRIADSIKTTHPQAAKEALQNLK